MSTTFNLTNSATEVNTALQAVVGADTTPTDESVNMVTSDGVFTYVATQVGALAGKTLTTESTGIVNTDNDTSVPTSAAVVDYVANYGKPTMGDLTSISAGSYTASTDIYITITSGTVKGQSHQNADSAFAVIVIDSVSFTVAAPGNLGNNSTNTSSASFFVKKGEDYVVTLPTASSGPQNYTATAHARTFNFTP